MTKMLNVSELKMKREGNMTNCLMQRFDFKFKFTLPQNERKSIRSVANWEARFLDGCQKFIGSAYFCGTQQTGHDRQI